MGMPRFTDYDAISFQYDCRYRVRDFRGIEQALLQFVGPVESSNLLEVGCGTGHWFEFMANQGRSLIGIDSSKQMLLRAREASPDWVLVKARAEDLPFPNSRFDRVFCINAYHHFTKKHTFLSEARRILRASGGLMTIALDPHTGQDKWWVYDYFPETVKLDKERYPPTAEIQTAMARYGFIRCKVKEVQHISAMMPARLAAPQGFLERGFTSQLTILSKEEYEAGIGRLNKAIEDAAALGEDLLLPTDLRLFGVFGWVG
jgi:ubiquinone/menaquinone biosynthesis C-methylase UbiE